MKKLLLVVIIAVAVLAFSRFPTTDSASARAEDPKAAPTYAKDVGPFIKKYCTECHGNAKAKAGVKLDGSYDSLMKASRRGNMLVDAGNPDKSVLLKCMNGSGYKKMPPRKSSSQPSKDEIAAIKTWIADGQEAVYPFS